MLDSVVLETSPQPEYAVIWLHGLGADGHDFAPIVSELQLPAALKIRFIFPHAPLMSVTVNGGYRMPAWYDILSQNILSGEDENGMRQSEKRIIEIIENEKRRGISAAKIILAGFSQGGAMTLFAGLRYTEKLAGLMVLSAYMPLAQKSAAELNAANFSTPIFMAHGRQDGVVPYEGGRISKDMLAKRGYPMEWHEYEMGHSVCGQEIEDISKWLQNTLK